MDTPVNDTSADELTLRSVDERIKQTTDPIFSRVEDLCALLASRTEMEYAGNSEASGSWPNHESISSLRNRYENDENQCSEKIEKIRSSLLLIYEKTVNSASLPANNPIESSDNIGSRRAAGSPINRFTQFS